MTNKNSYLRDKQNLKLKAALAKPEAPRYGDQVKLSKAIFDADEHFDSEVRAEKRSAMEGLSKQLSGNEGGTGTEAFFRGVNSGTKQGSILDDKKRMAKFKSGMEKWEKMVESQNEELANQERLYSARQAVMPNWLAYSKSFRSMSPADREQAIDSMIDKYNQVAGTSYKRGPVDGREPWKVTIIDGDEARVVDLPDLFKSPEEMRVEMMMQTPEYRQMEAGIQSDENMKNEQRNQEAELRKAKIDVLRQEAQDLQSFKELEDSVTQETGDSVIALDRFINKPSQWNHAIKDIETRIERGNAARKNIEILDRLEQIVNNNPNIFSSLNAIIANNQKTNPTMLSTLAANLSIKDKDRADFEEVGKLVQDLYSTELKSLPQGARLNQFLEKESRKKIPDLSQIPESFRRVISHIKKDLVPTSEEAQKVSDYYQKGLQYKPKIRASKEPEKSITIPSGEKLTPDEIRARDPRMKKFTNEQIEDWDKSKGAQ